MQRITLDSEISYVITEKELNEIRADERRKFAEWLDDKDYLGIGSYDTPHWRYAHKRLNYEDVLAEYERRRNE